MAHVIVKMDESMDFTDTLHVLIQEGADMAIPLTASGKCGRAEHDRRWIEGS